MGSQMFGSLLSGIILGYFKYYWYVVIMLAIAGVATFFLYFLKPPKIAESNNLIREKSSKPPGAHGVIEEIREENHPFEDALIHPPRVE